MTIQQTTPPGADVKPARDGQVQISATDVCGSPVCDRPVGEHPPVGIPGIPEGPMHVDGFVVGNARCGYQLALSRDGHLCCSCAGDNRRCGHTQSARAWNARFTRTVPFPLQASRP